MAYEKAYLFILVSDFRNTMQSIILCIPNYSIIIIIIITVLPSHLLDLCACTVPVHLHER